MARTVTFIHAADLHLGAPFHGLRALSQVWAERLRRAIPEAYRQLIDLAIEREVDFVVFAGDVFDDSQASYADYRRFIEGLEKLDRAGIPVYICTGNHDPYTSWRHNMGALPSNTFLFGAGEPTFTVFRKDGEPLVLLAGRGYRNQAWPAEVKVNEGITREKACEATGTDAPFAVGVIHTGLHLDPTRSPVEPRELMREDFDYWACGHIHMPMLIPEDNPRVVQSGCPQGRSINETGPHGVMLVTLTEGQQNKVELIPCAQVVWQKFELDISDCATVAEVQERITNRQFALNSEAHCQNMVCRVRLTGRTSLHADLTAPVISDLRNAINDGYPFFFIDSIVNATQAPLDIDALKREGLFPATYLQALDRLREDPAKMRSFLEGEFLKHDLVLPNLSNSQLETMAQRAQSDVLDLLGQEGDR